MVEVVFPNVLVLDAESRTSKAGNLFVVLRFLDQSSYEVYDVMQFGDAAIVASSLNKGARCQLAFGVVPGREGGVRLELVGMGAVDA